jgi:hypothetical protein
MQLTEISGDLTFAANVPPTAAGTAIEVPVIILPFNATITAIRWIPGAAMTANGTNFCTFTPRNRQAGAGAVVPATARSWVAGNSVATTPESLTLSGVAADVSPAAGDLITAHFTHSGTGLAIPAGLVQVTVRVR